MEPVILILIALVLVIGTATLLVTTRRRRERIELEEVRQSTLAPGAPTVPPEVKEEVARRDVDLLPPIGTPTVEEPLVVEPPVVEAPKKPKLRDRLAKARATFAGFLGRSAIDDETWDELEEALIRADVGVGPASALIESLKGRVKADGLETADQLVDVLKAEMKLRLAGTDRSLTITNLSVTTPTVVLFGSVGATPVTNDTLKNCIVINGANTSSAVVISDATTLGNAGLFSNITIQNNDVQKAFVGVFATGGTTPQGGSNLTYTQNTLTSSGANAIRDVALYMQGVNGATVTNNTVSNIDKVNDENDVGIWLATGTINATVSGNTISGIGYTGTGAFGAIGINVTSSMANTNNNITGNNVSDISSNGGTTGSLARGIVVSGATSDLTIQKNNVQGIINTSTGTFPAYGLDISGGNNVVVKNNFVSNINHDMTGGAAFSTTFGVFGIRVGAGTGHQIYHNSVNLYGAHTGTAAASLLSAAFAIVATTSTGCDVRDNIFANNITGGTTSIAHVSVFLPSGGTSAMNLTWNNNSYYFGTDASRQGIGQAGTTAGTNFFTTLPALAAYTSTLSPAATNDNASLASIGAVPFVSANDLHIGVSAPEVNAGVAIASVTDDIDGDMRPSMPDIGADEVSTTISSINLASASPVCGGTTVSWTVTLGASVTGLTTNNFALANTGLTSPMITGISGGGTTWTVTASTGTGSGTLGLNLVNSTGVTPAIGPVPFIRVPHCES